MVASFIAEIQKALNAPPPVINTFLSVLLGSILQIWCAKCFPNVFSLSAFEMSYLSKIGLKFLIKLGWEFDSVISKIGRYNVLTKVLHT